MSSHDRETNLRMKENLSSEPIIIGEVWAHNSEVEFDLIGQVIGKYNFILRDTEFTDFIYSPKVDYYHLQPSDNYDYLRPMLMLLNLFNLV
jgi:hypothetical protein